MSLQKLTSELYSLFEKGNYEQCQKLLPPVKIELIKHNLLVPLKSNTTTSDQINDLKVTQRILEIGALSSLLTNDYQGFENYFAQLRPFYANSAVRGDSKVHNTDATKIISLYLLYLLSQGLISKFHVELELIYNSPQYDTESDKYLSFPINLERNLMEGNYIKIWKLLKDDHSLPCKEYGHFRSTLIDALRFEIARSLEKTYDSIPVSNCKNLLYIPQETSDETFEAVLRNDLGVSAATIENGVIYFALQESDLAASDSSNLVANVLSYADQIELIV